MNQRDWHRLLGLAGLGFFVLLAVSGVALHYMSWLPSRQWVVVIQSLHTGAFLGPWGPYLYDAVAVGLLGLSATGLVLWYRTRQSEQKALDVREGDLFGDEGIFSVIWEAGLRDQHHVARILPWFAQHGQRKLFEKLMVLGDLEVRDGRVYLSESVQEVTKAHLRRHRLAERMLADWWQWDPEVLHAGAHRIEPVLSEEVEDGVCGLLGHPKACPHGSPIPEGPCCGGHAASSVRALSEMGVSGSANFVFAKVQQVFDDLTKQGALPGQPLFWHREDAGSWVVRVGEHRITLTSELASSILVAS